jgi:FAD-linked sulfhydryl oxidase
LTECPPDSLELGHSSWTLLHSMAAYYPSQPDPNTQQQCLNFLGALPTLYPCNYCAKHLGEEMKRMPPSCESREALEQWMCTMHNIVNKRLGKPEFDCTRVGQRWRDGC